MEYHQTYVLQDEQWANDFADIVKTYDVTAHTSKVMDKFKTYPDSPTDVKVSVVVKSTRKSDLLWLDGVNRGIVKAMQHFLRHSKL